MSTPVADMAYNGGHRRVAVVTGAGSGIGAATAKLLAAQGFHVICAARRTERIQAVADEIDGVALTCDVTSEKDVAALAEAVGGRLDVLVNNAGGALGVQPVSAGDVDQWRTMYETNVLGTLQVTKALLPALTAAHGIVVNVGSIAGHLVYEGGAGYTAAKHGLSALTQTLRLELWDQPVRVGEVAPGMVHTEEFSLVRLGGDQAKAEAVYAGVPGPLVAEDVAEAIVWMATRPEHVNIDLLVIKPRAQAAPHKVHRLPSLERSRSGLQALAGPSIEVVERARTRAGVDDPVVETRPTSTPQLHPIRDEPEAAPGLGRRDGVGIAGVREALLNEPMSLLKRGT